MEAFAVTSGHFRTTPAGRPRHRILVVDDSRHSAETLERLLLNEGYTVLALSSPTKAAQIGADFRPHIAILDLAMPVLDGVSLCKYLRRRPGGGEMHIIAFSGRDYGAEQLKTAGFDQFLMKPLDWPTFKVELARIAAKKSDLAAPLLSNS